ncbi:MAG: hypothetical protein R3C70_07140 [Geminicoccaceae bacterium]
MGIPVAASLERMIELWNDLASIDEIARDVGLTPAGVYKRIRENPEKFPLYNEGTGTTAARPRVCRVPWMTNETPSSKEFAALLLDLESPGEVARLLEICYMAVVKRRDRMLGRDAVQRRVRYESLEQAAERSELAKAA